MHATLVLFQIANHVKFMDIDPVRAAGHFVVLDPIDRSHLLYLTERAYLDYSRVAMSNDSTLIVLSRPEDDVLEIQTVRRSKDRADDPTRTGSSGSAGGNSQPSASIKDSKHNPRRIPSRGPGFFEELGVSEFELRSVHGLDLDIVDDDTLKEFVRDFVRCNSSGFSVPKLISQSISFFSRWRLPLQSDPDTRLLVGSDRNIRKLLMHWGSLLFAKIGFQLSSLSLRFSLLQISRHLSLIARNQGVMTAILRMKVAAHVVLTYLGGTHLSDTRHLGAPVSLTHGLPTFLPSRLRAAIRSGNLPTIRFVVSLLFSYKAIQGEWKAPKIDTIVNAPFIKPTEVFSAFAGDFFSWLDRSYSIQSRSPDLNQGSIPFSVKAGANFSVAPFSAAADTLAWMNAGTNHILNYLVATRQFKLVSFWTRCLNFVTQFPEESILKVYGVKSVKDFKLGKLSLKLEAAGKTRVFAITDVWTHVALLSLHKHLFSILKAIPMDATFDQDGALISFQETYANTDLYSYDLSAATDNIPVAITTSILSEMIGPEPARIWELLMTDREFHLSKAFSEDGESIPAPIRYGRGQPIGALSSWAGLAITHHFLVQLAAMRVDRFPYEGYRVLGDDIVISGSEVALSYHALCTEYEIPINQKGIISVRETCFKDKTLFNFASQVVWGNDNISPISLREELAIQTLPQRVNSLVRLYVRGHITNLTTLLSDLVRLSAGRISYMAELLSSMSRGEVPSEMRALMAAVLYPIVSPETGEISPSGPLIRRDKAPPIFRSLAYLFEDAKVLYGDVTMSRSDNWSEPLVIGSPAFDYWRSLSLALGTEVRQMVIPAERLDSFLFSELHPPQNEDIVKIRLRNDTLKWCRLGGVLSSSQDSVTTFDHDILDEPLPLSESEELSPAYTPNPRERVLIAINEAFLKGLDSLARDSSWKKILHEWNMSYSKLHILFEYSLEDDTRTEGTACEIAEQYFISASLLSRINSIPGALNTYDFASHLFALADMQRRLGTVVDLPFSRTDEDIFRSMSGDLPGANPAPTKEGEGSDADNDL